MPDKKIRLNIIGLSYSQTQTGAYALILGEETGKRRLPVIIGTSEAQAIAVQLEGLTPYRPLTHDLFLSMASAFHIELLEVNIVKLEEGVFFSELVCAKDGSKIKIDSRTSDAIALALRFKCPIFVCSPIESFFTPIKTFKCPILTSSLIVQSFASSKVSPILTFLPIL